MSKPETSNIEGMIWLGFMAGLAFLLVGFLIGPRVPAKDQKADCVGNVTLAGPFGFELNCDSPQLMSLARRPADLLAKDSSRQSRPGLVIAAAILQAPLSLIMHSGSPPQMIRQGTDDTAAIVKSFADNLPAYLAYVLLNIGILVASFVVLRKVMERAHDRPALDLEGAIVVVSAGLLLVANDVTKAFVWSPHMQLFNILVPVLALYVTLRLLRGGLLDRPFVLGVGLTVGLGLTAYPVFIVVTACAIPPAILALIEEKTQHGRAILHLMALIGLTVAPSLLWYAYVLTTTGGFSAPEIAQEDDVVWMAEAWAEGVGPFAREWLASLWELARLMAPQMIPLAVLAAWMAMAALRHRHALRDTKPAWLVVAAGLYVGVAVLGFYTCVGDGEARLAYAAIPPLLIATGALALALNRPLSGRDRWTLPAGFLLIAMAQMVFVIIKNGPWS